MTAIATESEILPGIELPRRASGTDLAYSTGTNVGVNSDNGPQTIRLRKCDVGIRKLTSLLRGLVGSDSGANRIGVDLRAECNAFIADEHAC